MGEPKNQRQTPWQGRQSGKSSSTWWGSSSWPSGLHPKGNGASAGDGKTSDKSILGKIKVVFRKG